MLNFDCTDLEMCWPAAITSSLHWCAGMLQLAKKSKASMMAWFYSPHREQMHINSRHAAENVGNVVLGYSPRLIWFILSNNTRHVSYFHPKTLFFLLFLYYWGSFRDHLCCLSFCFTASTVAFTWYVSMFLARLRPQSGQQIRTSAEGDLSQSSNRQAAAK